MRTDSKEDTCHISSFKCHSVYLILGLLGRRLIEDGVYKWAALISKIKTEENEIMCQFNSKQ